MNRRESVSLGSVVAEQTGASPNESIAGPIERHWDALVVEADHVVEAIHDEDAVTSDRLTIIGFLEAAGVLVGQGLFRGNSGSVRLR